MQNPLFPTQNGGQQQIPDYLQTGQPVQLNSQPAVPAASELESIRQNLAVIYGASPTMVQPLTKHQQFLQSLQNSGQPEAAVQAAWTQYYNQLPDHEKHEVWQHFYAAQPPAGPQQPQTVQVLPQSQAALTYQTANQPVVGQFAQLPDGSAYAGQEPAAPDGSSNEYGNPASVSSIKDKILQVLSSAGASTPKPANHWHSLLFGMASGLVVVFLFLLTFFNEVIIAPFIQPSRQATETPIIVDTASAIVGKDPKVIIPKINVEIPVDYTQTTTDEDALQKALNNGVIHYPTTVRPGQAGNAAFFGHSSNNILNPGKYKFAFLLLHKLVEGDTFYLTYEGKAYAYEVISRRVVDPTEVSVLGPVPNETATATLITCDPPGTSLKRLVVVGRQTSPDPAGNIAPPAANPVLASSQASSDLPGNGPTLWSRMWNSVF